MFNREIERRQRIKDKMKFIYIIVNILVYDLLDIFPYALKKQTWKYNCNKMLTFKKNSTMHWKTLQVTAFLPRNAMT